MNKISEQELLEKLSALCVCRGITKAQFKKASESRASTVEEIQKSIGTTKGFCCRKRCLNKIQQLMINYNQAE
jgi:bacterioferritin-associated ferredoxin